MTCLNQANNYKYIFMIFAFRYSNKIYEKQCLKQVKSSASTTIIVNACCEGQ